MARKLKIQVKGPLGGADGMPWGEMMLHVLQNPPPDRGLLVEEVIRSVAAMTPIQQAIAAGAATVTLTDEHWQLLRARLETTQWTRAEPGLVAFIQHIREAPEEGVATPPAKRPKAA